MAERPVEEPPASDRPQRPAQQPRRDPRDQPLNAQHPPERERRGWPRSRVALRAPARGSGARRARRAARGRTRSRSRARSGSPRRSAAGSGRPSRRRRTRRPRSPRGAGAGSSCPGSGPPRRRGRSASRTVGSLDVEAGIERADADPHLVGGREAPAVAGGHVGAVDPDLHVRRRAPGGCTSSPRESSASGGWIVVAGAEHAPPAERVDDQRRADLAAVGAGRVVRRCGRARRPWRSRTRTRPGRRAARTASGSRTSRTSTAGS